MKLLRFERAGLEGWAVQDDGSGLWHGTTSDAAAYPGALDAAIRAGRQVLDAVAAVMRAQPTVDLAQVRLLAPVAEPRKIICVGLNYRDHTEESGFEQPAYPTLFSRFNTSVVPHDAPLEHAGDLSDTLDFEGELVAVIGTGGSRIRHEDALSHVLAYSVFNDGSMREYQFKTPQWTMGKNFDRTGGFGPWLVTADELPPGARGLRLQTRLNGQVVQSANTDDMVFDVASLIVTISEAITLEPGDLIVAGTPAGIGHAREPRLYMHPGDVCEVEIERIGLLRNRIVSRQPAPTAHPPAHQEETTA
ncbi:fumarylacetoacetate hydrolase family protein [Hydrogenophaga palleronii]|uniref:fumarylacetoacetate hydrolase family protein n=1 Tax=Hydrogenophaga palleronii TaxID=65655 RepID=UPI0008259DF2|nr:fumarylacetoacetate hydrolase family protein [Hydrogenophaga palleronii]